MHQQASRQERCQAGGSGNGRRSVCRRGHFYWRDGASMGYSAPRVKAFLGAFAIAILLWSSLEMCRRAPSDSLPCWRGALDWCQDGNVFAPDDNSAVRRVPKGAYLRQMCSREVRVRFLLPGVGDLCRCLQRTICARCGSRFPSASCWRRSSRSLNRALRQRATLRPRARKPRRPAGARHRRPRPRLRAIPRPLPTALLCRLRR